MYLNALCPKNVQEICSTSTLSIKLSDQQIGQTKMQTKELSGGKVLLLSSEYDYLTNADFQNITRAPTQQLVF